MNELFLAGVGPRAPGISGSATESGYSFVNLFQVMSGLAGVGRNARCRWGRLLYTCNPDVCIPICVCLGRSAMKFA